ncbi:hypothetical protein [Oryzobacter telluris]|uniref:hypothetical protein n=1 Tax=Oryzobacter telluris TaxID=3149179 RepID=UPI00370D6AFF
MSPSTTTTKTTSATRGSGAFTTEEKAAMKARAAEARAEERASRSAAKAAEKAEEDRAACEAKIAELDDADRVLCERLHAVITTNAPGLAPRLYYGMPAYAKDGAVLCFVQPAAKFGTRYATLGFTDVAMLDDGSFWPNAWAITTLTAADEEEVAALVRRAVG